MYVRVGARRASYARSDVYEKSANLCQREDVQAALDQLLMGCNESRRATIRAMFATFIREIG